MTKEQIVKLLEGQRAFYRSGATVPVEFRIAQLKKLYAAVQKYTTEINDALKADLGKSHYEGFMCESGLVLTEISYLIRHVKSFARAKAVPTPLAQFPSRSFTQAVPYGTVLIMSPWNYPFLLSVEPLADAIAAGNTALLDQKFNLIFFTGSQAVGKEVLRHAAEHLTPTVLELGGKSPCIVDSSANIPLAAKRIVFGKYLNCGQTCVAPDYVLCEASVKDALLTALKQEIRKQYGEEALKNENYGKIINSKHFSRLCSLMDPKKVVHGGAVDPNTQQIAPTLMDKVSREDAIMQEEIFGPILPILTFDSFAEVIGDLKGREKPLALYLFSHNKAHIRTVTRELRYGGGCINDVVIHLATSALPFGGVGESGMGAYHGKAGFDTFSHRKSVVDKKTWLDLPMRYQPYTSKLYKKLLRLFLK